MTVLGITLGRATLAQVRAKLGPARLWRDGDASTAEMKVCYVSRGPDAVAIVFASNTEMAGPPESEVTDVKVVELGAYKDRSNCRDLTISGDKVRTTSGLGLGLTAQRVRGILGAPTTTANSAWNYFWYVEMPMPPTDKSYRYWLSRKEECFEGKEPFFTVSSGIRLGFDGDKVVSLILSRVESVC